MALSSDDDTLILYDFNAELPDGGGHDTVQSQVGSYPMAPDNLGAEDIVDGPGDPGSSKEFARGFSAERLSGTPDTTFNANINGDFTWEDWCWIYGPSFITTRVLFGIHDNGTQTNYSFIVRVDDDDGKVDIFWEDSGGGNITISPDTDVVPVDQWVHLAVRKQSTGGGTDQVDIFVNGSKTSTTATENFGDGDGGDMWIGGSDFFGSGWAGKMAGMRFTTSLLSDATIASHASDPSFELPSDPGDWARWEMTEPPSVKDLGSIRAHLKDDSFNGRPTDWQEGDPIDARDSRSIWWGTSSYLKASELLYPQIPQSLHNQNPITYEFWTRYHDSDNDTPLFYLAENGEVAPTDLISISLVSTKGNPGTVRVEIEEGGGTNHIYDSDPITEPHSVRYIAIRKVPKGSGLVDWEFYINGAHHSTVSDVLEVGDGSETALRIFDGLEGSEARAGSIRISSKLRTPTEISDEWSSGEKGSTVEPPNTTPPVVDNFAPATGPIQKDTPISFEVTDDEGDFARIMVIVEFGDGTYEVIHDGVKFAASYASKSSRKVISNGYSYTVERLGGWTSKTMTIRAIGVDSSGNVG